MDDQPFDRLRRGHRGNSGAPDDPPLTLTEHISTALVRVIRHPLFVLAYTAGTAYWWLAHPPANGWGNAFRDDAYPWPFWTSGASLLALWIESAVGISQYYAARRDAVAARRMTELMRAVSAQSDAVAEALHQLAAMVRHQNAMDEKLAAALSRIETVAQFAHGWMQGSTAHVHTTRPPKPPPSPADEEG